MGLLTLQTEEVNQLAVTAVANKKSAAEKPSEATRSHKAGKLSQQK